jgi:hypothetical protein
MFQLKQCSQVDRKRFMAEYVELAFQDQYLGRNDMWRIIEQLEANGKGSCIYVGQEVSFLESVAARVTAIHVNGQKVRYVDIHISRETYVSTGLCRSLWCHHQNDISVTVSQDNFVHSSVPRVVGLCWRRRAIQ